jgi:hypothetical protein
MGVKYFKDILRPALRWGGAGFILAIVLVCLGLAGGKVQAQTNLVPNPSFESNTGIPTGYSQINLAVSWSTPTNGSPDYFHALAALSSGMGVPLNDFGYQTPHGAGQAYAGFNALPVNFYREYVETPLSSPLLAGQSYQVSFYVSLADNCRWAVDKIGAYLSVGPVGPVNTAYNLPFTPQINNPATSYITNKAGWTLISGLYVAAGGEDHIVIGNFFDNPSTVPLAGQGGNFQFSYYYLDDVSVALASEDLGDAPDSTNHAGIAMAAGYSTGVQANFPTVYDPPSPGPAGPLHLDAKGFAWLGHDVTFEGEADTGGDQDGLNNIIPSGAANHDLKDDGVAYIPLLDCALTRFQFSATNPQVLPVRVFINVWFDWTSDGDWDDIPRCAADPVTTVLAPEWAVPNYAVTLAPGYNPGLLTPLFRSMQPPPGNRIWMRITLTDVAINAANHGGPFTSPADLGKGGSGPAGGYQFGETEDYFISGTVPVPGVSDWGVLALVLGFSGLFLLFLKISRRPQA